ncbi:MAG: tyrosine--tRNA ligase [Planctomycetota bacterium]|nr:tyrosine--tRNA ligase [Planctomycetota bacterium]
MQVLQELKERGFVKQCTEESALERALSESLTFYCGFDPTADSLHAGSLVPIMAMAHLQRAGHRPIAIIGGGTTMVGDPSGKTELRQMLDADTIATNGTCIEEQIGRYLKLDNEHGRFLNNADWLMPLRYVDFLREIGRYFRVNEMIKAEAYKMRLEREAGLSFIEFNYQLLQAYDFLKLYQDHGCTLQIGGDDQWGNIVAGTNLIRRVEGKGEDSDEKLAHGLTFPLLQTARGEKMGKTAAGAVWLSAERTSPYEFYQYWINSDDRDVERFLGYFTFLPIDEVRRLGGLQGADIRDAKEVLAVEATKLAHGADAAEQARTTSRSAFSQGGADVSAMPSSSMVASRLEHGVNVIDLFVETGLAESRGAIRRLIEQGGAYINGEKVTDIGMNATLDNVQDGVLLLRHGKKKFHRVVVDAD